MEHPSSPPSNVPSSSRYSGLGTRHNQQDLDVSSPRSSDPEWIATHTSLTRTSILSSDSTTSSTTPSDGISIHNDSPVPRRNTEPPAYPTKQWQPQYQGDARFSKRHPGPLDLSSTRSQPISLSRASALATARIIEDLGGISYPEGIKGPEVELNVNAKRGKFRYDLKPLLCRNLFHSRMSGTTAISSCSS